MALHRYITPVMYVDPSGMISESFLKIISGVLTIAGVAFLFVPGYQLLGATILGAGIGSFIGGDIAKKNNQSYLAGWVGGGITGAFVSFGLCAGGMVLNASTTMATQAESTIFGAFGIAGFFGGLGGGLGTYAKQRILGYYDESEILTNSLVFGISSTLLLPFAGIASALGAAGYTSAAGLYGITFEMVYDYATYLIQKALNMDEYSVKEIEK